MLYRGYIGVMEKGGSTIKRNSGSGTDNNCSGHSGGESCSNYSLCNASFSENSMKSTRPNGTGWS